MLDILIEARAHDLFLLKIALFLSHALLLALYIKADHSLAAPVTINSLSLSSVATLSVFPFFPIEITRGKTKSWSGLAICQMNLSANS